MFYTATIYKNDVKVSCWFNDDDDDDDYDDDDDSDAKIYKCENIHCHSAIPICLVNVFSSL